MKSEQQHKQFEGSYMGDSQRIPDDAVMECKICWRRYQPEMGDEYWQIPANTPFSQLPEYWRCPECDGDKNQFMRVQD